VAKPTSSATTNSSKRYGQALGGVTPFDEEVDRWANIHEANYAKMRAANRRRQRSQNPSEME